MSIKDQALKSKKKYSQEALVLLDQMKDEFDMEEFEKFVEREFFIIGSTYIIAYLNFRKLQKEKANKKHLCNPQK